MASKQIFDCVVRVEQGGALNRQPHDHGADGSVETTLVDPKSIEAVLKSIGAVPKSFDSCSEVN